ncbi:MAG: GNAT family N-acetyltransferase [Pseudomonadota bacterium]
MHIRPALPADATAICALHIASWRDAYRDHLPDAYLGDPVAADLAALWADIPESDLVFVAERSGEIEGFVAFRLTAPGLTEDGPLLDNLHVAPGLRGGGIGEGLMRQGMAELATRGLDRFWLTVLENNHAARRFYRRLGGSESVPFAEALKGNPVSVCKVTWRGLKV